MQRITWSGIAIHAGVLPGYPASHGCIRMPMAFAMKMWNWTCLLYTSAEPAIEGPASTKTDARIKLRARI